MTDLHSGASFDDFLEEEGILHDVQAASVRRVAHWLAEQEPTQIPEHRVPRGHVEAIGKESR